MALSINNNIQAFNAYRNLSVTQGDLSKSLEKLSSGFRINRAADDAAGLAISEGLRSQVGGLKQASRNAQDGISVVQTAEGALTEVHSILQRVRTLAVQGANDSNSADARTAINKEVGELGKELTRISASTNFNGTDLLTTDAATKTLNFQVGAGAAALTNSIGVKGVDVQGVGEAITALSDGTTGTLDTADGTTYSAALTTIDAQIKSVSDNRATLGAVQNRFEHTINNLNVAVENLSASESRIRDTDMAMEMTSFTRSQILSQAGTAMLAQANQIPQGVLSLLR